ncbi:MULTISPECIES: cation diffusion facilitator family transporter [Methanosarcina]|uniref:Cation transporter n=1 Tax=Methanosarcina mazei TaxID=2209 RepID=A0A0F8RPV6_METMZ|nr:MULTISPECIES: cation diffusion facilitator family transporter [Methanosarcina]KKG05381.1 cation transporter [Methanosarcina mazei]KKG34977.1 cation transporter [Methanosarcina mazei]KKG38355.1 cation transporter [Methanosarcina mazei]KKG61701.1 cation transporter [Methanosarcina mazei]KKG75998.1 cation transporter [Methanosarcina mazei]
MKAEKNLNKTLKISYKALFFSFALTLIKLLAGFLGNSTALIADSIRSFSELINELKKLLEVFIASKPEDWSHNYGHGKVATLFTGAGACILLFAGIESISLASQELLIFIQGRETEAPEILALSAAALTLVSREIIPLFSSKGKEIEGTLSGTGIYTRNAQIRSLLLSCFVTLGIGCTFLPGKNWVVTDSFIAALMSLYLLGTSGKLLYGTANELIEASLDEEDNKKIRKIINTTEGVTGSGELKTRKIGNGIAINACITVSDSLNIQEVAEIADRVENRLKTVYGEDIYALVKAEPDPGRNCSFRKKMEFSEEGRKENKGINTQDKMLA